MAGDDWSDEENDRIVTDYFDMLTDEIEQRLYNKAAHRRALLAELRRRSEPSIEFKHRNISAVMLGLGQPWISGYKPASQFQASLIDAVVRRLAAGAIWSDPALLEERRAPIRRDLGEYEPLWIGPPPTLSNAAPVVDPSLLSAIASRFHVAERDERNRDLGRAGEHRVFMSEIASLRAVGRSELAERVNWVSEDIGDGAGYDIKSFEPDGRPRLLEVKTTNGWERTPFHISRNELAVADENREHWHLIRVWDFAREPKAFSIRPPLQSHVALTPTSFLASLI